MCRQCLSGEEILNIDGSELSVEEMNDLQENAAKYIEELTKKREWRKKYQSVENVSQDNRARKHMESARDELLAYIRYAWYELPLARDNYYGTENQYQTSDEVRYDRIVDEIALGIMKALFNNRKVMAYLYPSDPMRAKDYVDVPQAKGNHENQS